MVVELSSYCLAHVGLARLGLASLGLLRGGGEAIRTEE